MSQVQTSTNAYSAVSALLFKAFKLSAVGVIISAIAAYFTLSSAALVSLATSGTMVIVFLVVWFGVGFMFHRISEKVSPAIARLIYFAFSAFTGFALSPVLLVYSSNIVLLAFLATIAVMVGAAMYGYFTKKDMTGLAPFLSIACIGLIIFAVILIGMSFFSTVPSWLDLFFSALVVPLITVLLAFKVNMVRKAFVNTNLSELELNQLATPLAFSFYLDFVVLFLHIMNLLNGRD